MRDHIATIFANWPDLRFEERSTYVGDDFVVQEWRAHATHSTGRSAAPGTASTSSPSRTGRSCARTSTRTRRESSRSSSQPPGRPSVRPIRAGVRGWIVARTRAVVSRVTPRRRRGSAWQSRRSRVYAPASSRGSSWDSAPLKSDTTACSAGTRSDRLRPVPVALPGGRTDCSTPACRERPRPRRGPSARTPGNRTGRP